MRELLGICYILRFIICGIALGTVFIRMDVFTHFSKVKVWGIGFCTTPMIIALVDYMLALLWKGIPVAILNCFLPIVAICFLCKNRNREILFMGLQKVKCRINQEIASTQKSSLLIITIVITGFLICLLLAISSKSDLLVRTIKMYAQLSEQHHGGGITAIIGVFIISGLVGLLLYKSRAGSVKTEINRYVIYIGMGLIGAIILSFAFLKTNADLFDWDRSHYELQARYFAETRDAYEIDNYHDEKYGTVFMDDHGPLWPVYIADARMVAGGYDDYFNPLTIDLAYFLLVVCYLMMVGIVAWTITDSLLTGCVSIIVLCMYRNAFRYYIIGSRDSFRVLGILLLALFILEITCRLYDRKNIAGKCLRTRDWFVLNLLCYLCMQGHASNAYIMLGLFLIFGLIAIYKKMRVSELIYMASGVLFGTVFGVQKAFIQYFTTGSIQSNTTKVFEGTEAATKYIEWQHNENFTWKTVFQTYYLSDYLIILLGMLGIVYALVIARKKCKQENNKYILFSVLTVGLLLPLTGVMNFLGYNASLSFIMHERYRLYFIVLLSIVGVSGASAYMKNNYLKRTILMLSVFFAFNNSMMSMTNMDVTSDNAYAYAMREFAEEFEEMAGEGNIFVQNEVFAYYFHKNPKLLYHPIARELIVAQNEVQIEQAIQNLNIKVISFEPYVNRYDYSVLPFYNYLQTSDNVERKWIQSSNDYWILAYILE